MKIKRLLNTSEYKTFNELQKAFCGKGYYIHPQLLLKLVVEREVNEHISKKEKDHLENATLDFVIYNKELLPEFVIEFDGPYHETNSKQKGRDIVKNRILSKARLPLLRVNDFLISEFGTMSLLRYICERFLAWHTEINDIDKEIADRRPLQLLEDDILDPMYDSSFIFDVNYPFPATVGIAERLYQEHKIVTNFLEGNIYSLATSCHPFIEFRRNRFGDGPLHDYSRRMERSYMLERHSYNYTGKYILENVYELWVTVDYVWGYPTTDNINFKDLVPTMHFSIPGTSIHDLMDNYCDFKALCKIETWVKENMGEDGVGPN